VGPALQVGDSGDEGLLHIDGLDRAIVTGRGLDGEHEDVVLVVGRVLGGLGLADLDQAAALGVLVVCTPANIIREKEIEQGEIRDGKDVSSACLSRMTLSLSQCKWHP
jgi:hypothetical protein